MASARSAAVVRLARWLTLQRTAKLSIAAALVFFGALIINGFPNYFPPRFDRGFLINRQSYFVASGYAVGFYLHILASPVVLVLGILQFSSTLRRRWPQTHRGLGKAYVVLVLFAMAPGGIVLASRSFAGTSATICFVMLCILVWWFTWQAWQTAVSRRFAEHRVWMMRSYLMITSAVTLRLVHYALSHWPLDRVALYQWAAWLSWVPTLLLFELALWWQHRTRSG